MDAFAGRGPHTLLWAGSWVVLDKITSGTNIAKIIGSFLQYMRCYKSGHPPHVGDPRCCTFRVSPMHAAAPVRLIIWRPFKPIILSASVA
jgi:hypothetical protein